VEDGKTPLLNDKKPPLLSSLGASYKDLNSLEVELEKKRRRLSKKPHHVNSEEMTTFKEKTEKSRKAAERKK